MSKDITELKFHKSPEGLLEITDQDGNVLEIEDLEGDAREIAEEAHKAYLEISRKFGGSHISHPLGGEPVYIDELPEG